MDSGGFTASTVPVRYASVVLDAAAAAGVEAPILLDAAAISHDQIEDPGERLALTDVGRLLVRALRLTDEPGLGYEIGLGSSPLSPGIVGLGMSSSSTLREAIDLGVEFIGLRVPVLSAELRVDGDTAAVAVVETAPLGELRQVLFDTVLVKLARIGLTLVDGFGLDDVELWFDYPEPEYYRRSSGRLPRASFDMGSNEVRFDAALLDLRPETADPDNATLIRRQCRRELEELGLVGDAVAQVRAVLVACEDGYPTLGDVADRLHTSSRTLKRRLHDRGTSFHRVLDETRRARAIRLLSATDRSVETIAHQLGYADPSGFRRAFQSWTGRSPADFRRRGPGR